MSPFIRRHSRQFILSLGIATLLGASRTASAVDITKNDNADPLNLGTSWSGGIVPGAGDVALWSSVVTGANTVSLGADLSFGGIRITNPGGAVTINAGNTLTLGASGIDMSAATQDLTLAPALVLAATQQWLAPAVGGRTLTVRGPVNLGANTLAIGGQAIVTGAVSGAAPANAVALTVAPNSNLLLSGLNTFTGRTTIVGGATVTASSNSTGAGNSALGATGAGNETIVANGGTLNVGGSNLGAELVQIQGTGVGGNGALMNDGAAQNNALQFVALTGDATVNASGSLITGFSRFDIRTAAYTAGAKNLDLAGFTLTKNGGAQFSLVNADVTAGNIVVNDGLFSIEADTRIGSSGTNSITVNAGGRLGFFALAATATVPSITVAGGSLGETSSSSAVQTVNSPINFTTASGELFATSANGPSFAGLISGTAGGAFTEIVKRGAGTITLSNPGNTFNAPLRMAQGILRADYTTPLGAGGLPPDVALTTTDTPLGTANTLMLTGGTLAVRINMLNDTTVQQFDFDRAILIDRAPSAMTFDRLSNTAQTNKLLIVKQLTFAPPSSSNGYSIGQNQLTFTQANTHRLQLPSVTMNGDTVFTTGDFNFTGDILAPNRESLVRTGGNTMQFVGDGANGKSFGAFLNLGTGSVRIGSGFGTPITSDTVTVGTGTIYGAPNSLTTFRAPGNIAPGQIIELVSQRQTQATFNFEQFTAIPAALRASGGGVIGVGNASAFGDIDLARIGDGTFRIGSNFGGSGNGTIIGVVSPGSDDVVRLGGGGTVTLSSQNAVSGSARLEIGSPLINGGFATSTNNAAQSGTVLLVSTNDFRGGTTVNRGSTLRIQDSNSIGAGPVELFGTLAAELETTFANADGSANVFTPQLRGGSTLHFNNGGLTDTVDVNRWADAAPIALLNGTLQITSRNENTSITSETVGDVSFSGGSIIQLNRQNAVTGNTVLLNVAGLTRIANGTVELGRSGGGTGSGFGAGSRLLVTGTPPVVTNGMVQPFITLNDNTRLINFVGYNGSTGFVNAAYTATVNTAAFPTGFTTGTEIIYVDYATGILTATLGDNPVIYALKVGAGQSAATATTLASGAGNQITLRSGGLIISGDTTAGFFSNGSGTSATINPALVFNDGAANIEALINVRTGTTGVLAGTITANGLTKSGPGTLQLRGANLNTVSGPVTVNGGVLDLRTADAAGAGPITLAGGQLNVRASGAALTLPNSLTIRQNIPIATLDVANLSATPTAAVGVTFNAAAANSPGLTLEGSTGAQGQTLTLASTGNATNASISSVVFGTNMLNSFTGNVTINTANTRTLQLNNSPTLAGTAPVLTKSGDGTLIIGAAATPGTTTVSPDTRVVLNAGILELRSVFAVGTGATTALTLNGGTLNLRRDSAGNYGGTAGSPYPVTIDGNTTISVDRTGGTATNYAMGIGPLTINGSPNVTFSNANGIYLDVLAPGGQSLQLNGLPFLTSNITPGSTNTALRLGGEVAGGGFIKLGTGHLHLLSTNSYDGGTYVNQGIVRARVAGALGTGPVFINPGGILDLNAADNLNPGQRLTVRSNSAFIPMISVNTDFAHPTTDVNVADAPVGIIGLSNTTNGIYETPINMATLYGGNWYLGGISTGAYDARYTAPTLGAGAGNTYRLGGGGLAFVLGIDASNLALNNVLTGPNKVVVGFDSGNLRTNATTFQFVIGGTHDYSGATVIHRGSVVRLVSPNDEIHSGLSGSAVDVFGSLILGSNASLVNTAGAATNALNLHPGAMLHFDNANGGGNGQGVSAPANLLDRLSDTLGVTLHGALLNLLGASDLASSENLGNITYSRGARLRVARTNSGTNTSATATLTLNNLLNGGPGSSLMIQTAAANTLGAATNYDRIIVNSPPPVTNGMVTPSIINATDNTFVTYGANGFANATYNNVITTGTYAAGALGPGAKVDIATAALTLTDNPIINALRTSQNINLGNAFNTITLRSGGFIGTAGTIQPNLVFNDGTANIEARIYNSGTVTINGTITANGITKFGTGNLTINAAQAAHTSGWHINSGTVQINDLQGLGQSVPGNAITLTATPTTGGSIAQAFAQTNLTFNRDGGTPDLAIFSGGPITLINEATIRVTAGVNDRNFQIPPVIVESTGDTSAAAFTFDVPFSRTRAVLPSLTLSNDAIVRVFDSGSTTDTGRVVAGVVNVLNGANKNLTKIGNRTLELGGDNSTTFTGGSITVGQGTVRVLHNGALGNAATAVKIERNATLEIGVANFAPIANVQQLPGSIERWNIEAARPATYNLPAGVNLQLNTNLTGTHTIGLSGGSLEGFLWIDHPAPAVQRIVGASTTINLLADSFIGQNVLQGQGYDLGRQPTVTGPFGDNVTGTFLRIDGKIAGAFNLTKTGLDTVILGNNANTYNNTIVDMGDLRIAATDALPPTKVLTTRFAGTFDLYGFDQHVAGLGTANSAINPGGTGPGASGRIINSATTDNILTVTNSADFTYNGTIEQNVALTKAGTGKLTLSAEHSYRGATTIAAGTLELTGTISGSPLIDVQSGAIFDVTNITAGFVLGAAQTLKGGGTVNGFTSVNGTIAPGATTGTLTIAGPVNFNNGSTLSLEIAGPAAFDKLASSNVALDDTVHLTIALTTIPAFNTQFLVVDNTGTLPISGSRGLFTWSGPEGVLSEGEQFRVGTQDFTITYRGGSGNDVVLTAVPEPTTPLAVGAGLWTLLALRRRHRRFL
jgi:autotransporter-associated beta strand protein